MDRRSTWHYGLKSLVGAIVTTLLCSNFAIADGQSVVRDNGLSTAVIEPSRLIAAGTYVFEGGWGDLKIERSIQQETLSFSIEAMGANAHQCELSGVIRKGEAVLVDEKNGEQCRLLFRTRRDNGLDVLATDLREGGCREYCGTRAFFAGTYFRPAENCSKEEVVAVRGKFQEAFDRRAYVRARRLLEPMFLRCQRTIWQYERDRIANDLALTMHRMGDDVGCRRTLASLVKLASTPDDVLNPGPVFQEELDAIVRSTRTNLRLCKFPLKIELTK